MLPRTALQIVRDELILDGNARLNLATFVTTWMEPEAELLMAECSAKNMIDKDEYPQTAELERRCVNILSHLWNAPDGAQAHRLLHHRVERGLHARRDGAAVALAGPAPGGRAGHRQAEPGHGRQRAGVLGEVLPLLAGRAPLRADGAGAAAPGPGRSRGQVRREHHRRGRDPGLHHGRQLRAGAAEISQPWTGCRPTGAWTSRCTSTGRRAGSSPRSFTGPGVGLPGAAGRLDQRLGAQVRPGLPRRGLGHLAGRRPRCPTTWSSTSTTWAARCPRSR